jgi:hypothetical protein
VHSTNLSINIPESYLLAAWILFCAGGSLIIIYNLSLNVWFKGVLIIVISAYTVYLYMREACRLLPTSWCRVQQLTTTEWLLANQRNQPCAGIIRADTFVSSWLIVLRFNRIGHMPTFPKIMSIPLFITDVDKESWRRLQIYLRWQVQRGLNKK